MAEDYYLKVMGTPALFDQFGRPVRFKVRKHLALLIYLVLDGRPTYRRDHLVELLWPGPNNKGSQSLSMAFSTFRAVFGHDVVASKKDIAQFRGPPIVTDLERLQRRALFGNEIDSPLEVDGLLQDFDIQDAQEFQHWIDGKRAEHLPAIKAGLGAFIAQARRSGETSAMQTFAGRLLLIDPLTEQGIVARMEALALQADRLSALRLYETWKQKLHQELGAIPSRELEAFAARLRKDNLALAANPAAAIVERQAERPFVGRTIEYRVLFEAWETTLHAGSTHVLLTGESGIGKSTLAIRFGSMASLAGAAVARVQCFELEQRIAFGMIGALVAELVDKPGVAGTAPASLAEVARIVPRVRERFPGLPQARDTEGEAARLRFAEGTFALFDAIMEEQPLVLIVDDYPRSDEASLSVLHLLLRRSENRRLMVVLAGRPPSSEDPPQAARIRRAISHLPMRRVDLQALTDGECEELLQSALRGIHKAPSAPERRAMIQAAAGNPMALELLTRDWIAHPDTPLALLLTAMRSEVTGAALGAADYDQFIERILTVLSARHRVALFLAVILGPRLNDFTYFGFLDLAPRQVMAALSELVEHRLLRSTERGFEFVNEVMRARLYLSIPVATRIRLHDGVASFLIDEMGRGESVSRLEIAWHCIRAKRRDEAAPHLIIGARQSLSKGAPDEAARALGTALGELRGQTWEEAALLLAEAYDEMGDYRAILDVVGELKATRPSDPSVQELADELEIEAKRGLKLLSRGEAIDLVREFIASFRNRNTAYGRSKAALSSVKLAIASGDMDLLEELQQSLARLPIETFEPKEKAMARIAQAMTAFHRRDTVASIHAATLASTILEESGNQDASLASLTIGLGVVAMADGDYLSAIPQFKNALALSTRLGNEGLMSMAAQNLALAYLRTGDYESQNTWALRARQYQNENTIPFNRVIAASLLGMASTLRGNRDEALDSLGLLQREIARCDSTWVAQFGQFWVADILWLLGRQSEALDFAIRAGAGGVEPKNPALIGPYSRWSALVSTNKGVEREQFEILRGLQSSRQRLDALDRAELDCAVVYLGHQLGLKTEQSEKQLSAALTELPRACGDHLEALGLLVAHSRTQSFPEALLGS